MRSTIRKALIIGMWSLIFSNAALALEPNKLQVVPLTIGIHVIQAEYASSNEERMQGLMFRKQMGTNEGMMFRFDRNGKVCMWMKNTLLPLSVAFIDEEGSIINIEDMQPETLDSHCAEKPARYALEMNQGWFKRKNIKSGSKINGLPK